MQILMQMHAEHERQVSLLAARSRRRFGGRGLQIRFCRRIRFFDHGVKNLLL
jgi:hypothetical protein